MHMRTVIKSQPQPTPKKTRYKEDRWEGRTKLTFVFLAEIWQFSSWTLQRLPLGGVNVGRWKDGAFPTLLHGLELHFLERTHGRRLEMFRDGRLWVLAHGVGHHISLTVDDLEMGVLVEVRNESLVLQRFTGVFRVFRCTVDIRQGLNSYILCFPASHTSSIYRRETNCIQEVKECIIQASKKEFTCRNAE